MSQVVFVNRFYAPDQSATSQMLTDLAEHLVARGERVTALAAATLYSDASVLLPKRETLNGVEVRRLPTSRFGRASLPGRVVDYLTFYLSAAWALLRLTRRGDIVVAKTDPPLISVLCGLVCRLKGARLINWLQDLYPEVAAAHGIKMMAQGPSVALLRALRDRSLQAAAANVVISEAMGRRAVAAGGRREAIHVIPNWSDDETILPVPPAANPLRETWGLRGRFVVGYSGNLGRAHEFDTLLQAAERLRDHPTLTFLFIGGGHGSGPLAQAVSARGLRDRFLFKPYQPRSELDRSLSAPDLHWVSLRPEFEGLIFPSKLYGVAAAGRGILVVGDAQGEMARLVERHGCGAAVAMGDADRLASLLADLAADPERVAAMGRASRAMLEAEATKAQAFARWRAVIESLETDGRRP